MLFAVSQYRGDSVIGHFTAERGLVVHQERCKNILSVREDPQQCFPVNWGEPSGRSFNAQIKVVGRDEPGLLAQLGISNYEPRNKYCFYSDN